MAYYLPLILTVLLTWSATPLVALQLSSRPVHRYRTTNSPGFLKAHAPPFLARLLSDTLPLQLKINGHPVSFSHQSPIQEKLLYHFDKQYHALCYQLQLTNDEKDTVSDITLTALHIRLKVNPAYYKPRIRYMTGSFH